jgi:Tol biopolymer transport system component
MAVEIVEAGGRNAVWIYDLSGATQIRRLTQEGSNSHPIWTPDSRRIAFASNREGPWGIYWQAADGTGTAERLSSGETGGQQWPESWSPDGAVLAFVKQAIAGETGSQSLWTLSVARGVAELFHEAPNTQNGMAFSPNGKWIAYSSNEAGGAMNIFVAPFPAVPGIRYQVSTNSETYPLWSRDGRALFYRTSASDEAAVQRVEIRSESPFTFTNVETLPGQGFLTFPNYTNYDLTPDGERLLVVIPAEEATTQETRPLIRIVENWFEELRQVR